METIKRFSQIQFVETEKIAIHTVHNYFRYLISYLLFEEKAFWYPKGGFCSVRYLTPKTWSESCETMFISVRIKYLSDRSKIFILRNSLNKTMLCFFFQIVIFFFCFLFFFSGGGASVGFRFISTCTFKRLWERMSTKIKHNIVR